MVNVHPPTRANNDSNNSEHSLKATVSDSLLNTAQRNLVSPLHNNPMK